MLPAKLVQEHAAQGGHEFVHRLIVAERNAGSQERAIEGFQLGDAQTMAVQKRAAAATGGE